MDSEKQEFWRAVLKEQNKSNQTIKSFCDDYGIAVWQFHYWKKRLCSKSVSDSGSGFNELTITDSKSTGLRLYSGNVEIRLDSDFNPDLLKKVLRVLNC